jgi:hypothetical protein
MPTVSLRLSEEQHATLVGWAHASHRSVQRELVHRLFGGGVQVGEAAVTPGAAIRLEPGLFGAGGPPPALLERGALETGDASADAHRPDAASAGGGPRSESARCSAATPYGTRCKTCGKVHTW